MGESGEHETSLRAEAAKLRNQVDALQRQNKQLQSHAESEQQVQAEDIRLQAKRSELKYPFHLSVSLFVSLYLLPFNLNTAAF